MGTYSCPDCGANVHAHAFKTEGTCPDCGRYLKLGFADTMRETSRATEAGMRIGLKVLLGIATFLAAPLICLIVGIVSIVKKRLVWGIICLVAGVLAAAMIVTGAVLQGSASFELPVFLIYIIAASYVFTIVVGFMVVFGKKKNTAEADNENN